MSPGDDDALRQLREYVDDRLNDLRRELDLVRTADQRANELARSNMDRRLDTMNEFRSQVLEERRLYIRVDTFRWTVGFIVSLMLALSAIGPFIVFVIRGSR